jgi:AraC-like DNA-binding protein
VTGHEAPPFRFAERAPDPALTPWIASYWEFTVHDGAPPLHHVPPDGCTSLLMPVGGPHDATLLYSGPWLSPLTIPVQPGMRFVGVRLRPGAVAGVLELPAAKLVNATAPAVVVGGERGQRLQRDLVSCFHSATALDARVPALDAFWISECSALPAPDSLVSAIVDAVVMSAGERRIAELARAHGCADRTLRRRFRTATGLSPKEFSRVRRLLAAAWHAVDGVGQWGRIAAEAGYADHAHLHHELKDLMGLRPEQLMQHLRDTQRDGVSRQLPAGG